MAGDGNTRADAGHRARGRRTKDMPDGRQALIRAGIAAFAGAGFEAADLRSIAAAASVSPNLVRVHFGSKADLWDACLDAVAASAEPTIARVSKIAADAARPVGDRLRDVIVAVADFYAAHPEVRDFATRQGVGSPERAACLAERLQRPAYQSVRELFAAGIEAGIVRSAHPALFFALVNSALNQPPSVPALLARLAPEIDPATARAAMNETVLASLLHRSAGAPPTGFEPIHRATSTIS
jgi:AcrR family transcriptional regulator